MYILPDGLMLEAVVRDTRGPIYWPCSWWNGSSGEDVKRTTDGKRWFTASYSGWDGPRNWYEIKAPVEQPALRG